MLQLVHGENATVGKTIVRVGATDENAYVIVFSDGTYQHLQARHNYDSDPLIEELTEPELSNYLVRYGVMTQEELDEHNRKRKAAWEADNLKARQQQYERLKQEFEPKT